MSSLSSLPTELLCQIVSHISDRSSLITLAQTCSLIYPIAQERLTVQPIEIHNLVDIIEVSRRYKNRREDLGLVQELSHSLSFHAHTYDFFLGMLGLMKDLETLNIHFRYKSADRGPNFIRFLQDHKDDFWGDVRGGYTGKPLDDLAALFVNANSNVPGIAQPPIRNLKSLSLDHPAFTHFNFDIILSSQTLVYLHLAHINFWRSSFNPTIPKTTPLRTLILESCDLETPEFISFLSLPKALRKLIVDEGPNKSSFNRGLPTQDLIQALQNQSESLEVFHFNVTEWWQLWLERQLGIVPSPPAPAGEGDNGLGSLTKLHTLELNSKWVHRDELLLGTGFAPPHLRTYHLTELKYPLESVLAEIAILSAGPDFKTVKLSMQKKGMGPTQGFRLSTHGHHLINLLETARALHSRGIVLEVEGWDWHRGCAVGESAPYTPHLISSLFDGAGRTWPTIFKSDLFCAKEAEYTQMVQKGFTWNSASKNGDAAFRAKAKELFREGHQHCGSTWAAQLATGWRQAVYDERVLEENDRSRVPDRSWSPTPQSRVERLRHFHRVGSRIDCDAAGAIETMRELRREHLEW
ncbi:hypothetical protein DM02DRAFT_662341 [Periconia macrospinosa]|uniref:F-box domain-containing protein n=1 Tax=Periconia macrospinosa TaxID=97972 RepID=A0A2V1D4S0_9PLEO|nr:hypothetical protein DM02DRAFT_662341 [Periconia macrospinosa]